MKKITLVLLSLFLLKNIAFSQKNHKQTTTQESKQVIETVDVKTFKELLNTQQGKVVLLDVRTPEEYKQGHIENAKNIDVLQNDFAQKVERLDKNTPVFVYCRSGHRSMKAAQILKEKGFKKVYNLDGGYIAWSSQQK
jgi:rhodanese-related sulfurtransferase